MGITFSEPSNNLTGQYGYHVLRVQQNSPAQLAGLQPFFDFILSIDGHNLGSDHQQHQMLNLELSRHLGHPVQLSVYSSKRRQVRCVALVPSNAWGGQGLLGASVRLCSMVGSPALAWRVLDVAPGSPACFAGLHPSVDYIVGADAPLHSPEDLFDLIESRLRCPTQLYVYCATTDGCREVTVTPDPSWGGEGALGAGIGYGYLHQIPVEAVDGMSANDLPANLPSAPESAKVGAGLTTTGSSGSTAACVTVV